MSIFFQLFWRTMLSFKHKTSKKICLWFCLIKLVSATKGLVTCECDHLTSFGIMMDVSTSLREQDPGKLCSKELCLWDPGKVWYKEICLEDPGKVCYEELCLEVPGKICYKELCLEYTGNVS